MFDLDVQGARYCSVLVFRGWVLFNPGIQAAGDFSPLVSRRLEFVRPWCPWGWRMLTSGVQGAGVCPPLVFRGMEIV